MINFRLNKEFDPCPEPLPVVIVVKSHHKIPVLKDKSIALHWRVKMRASVYLTEELHQVPNASYYSESEISVGEMLIRLMSIRGATGMLIRGT